VCDIDGSPRDENDGSKDSPHGRPILDSTRGSGLDVRSIHVATHVASSHILHIPLGG
jgi:hypothetical protein